MSYSTISQKTLISGLGYLFIILILPGMAFAETSTVKAGTTVKVETSATTTDKTTVDKAESTTETTPTATGVNGIWNSIKSFAITQYNHIDQWRVSQLEIWNAIKKEKQIQIDSLSETTEENRDARVDGVLNGDQVSLFAGSSKDFKGNGNIFLTKIYVIALSGFIFIFSTPILFYAIIVFVVVVILKKFIEKLRTPNRF